MEGGQSGRVGLEHQTSHTQGQASTHCAKGITPLTKLLFVWSIRLYSTNTTAALWRLGVLILKVT